MTPPPVDPNQIIDTGNPHEEVKDEPKVTPVDSTPITPSSVEPAEKDKDDDRMLSIDPLTGEVIVTDKEQVDKPKDESKVVDKDKAESKTTSEPEDNFDIKVDFSELDKTKDESVEIKTEESKPDASTRNLDDVDPSVRPYAKQMSNEAFEAVKSLTAKAKQVEEQASQLPTSYFENPNAYKLTPEYQKAAVEVQTAESLINFVTEQIVKGRDQGGDVNLPVYDPQKGWVTGQPLKYNARVELELQKLHSQFSTYQVTLQKEAEQVATRFKERASAYKNAANNFFSQRFGNAVSADEQKQAVELLRSQGITETVPIDTVGNLLMVIHKLNNKTSELTKKLELQKQQSKAEPGIDDAKGAGAGINTSKGKIWYVDEF